MNGTVLFQDAIKARLDLIQPSKEDIKQLLATRPLQLTNGVDEVIRLLHARGTHVYLVSGGFRQVLYCLQNLQLHL